MAYNEATLQRMREFFQEKDAGFYEKKMFGGVCILVDDKMCSCVKTDKSSGEERLLCRIGEVEAAKALAEPNVGPMYNTDRSMKDFVYVSQEAFQGTGKLHKWLQLCLDYNPTAKSSKK
jgi:TfoX/Sxy family transcriptional regulator of competence genes